MTRNCTLSGTLSHSHMTGSYTYSVTHIINCTIVFCLHIFWSSNMYWHTYDFIVYTFSDTHVSQWHTCNLVSECICVTASFKHLKLTINWKDRFPQQWCFCFCCYATTRVALQLNAHRLCTVIGKPASAWLEGTPATQTLPTNFEPRGQMWFVKVKMSL